MLRQQHTEKNNRGQWNLGEKGSEFHRQRMKRHQGTHDTSTAPKSHDQKVKVITIKSS